MLTISQLARPGDPHAACFSHVVAALRSAAESFPDAQGTVYIGAHTASGKVPDGATIYNFEQVAKDSPWMHEAYIANCRKARLWDYSSANVRAWKEIYGIDAELLPLGYDPAMVGVVAKCKRKLIPPAFYGSTNARRLGILARMPHTRMTNPCYGDALDHELSLTPCVVNIHFYESAIFEIVRCSYLFANAVPVMSEESADGHDYAHIPNLFHSIDTMAELARARRYPSGDAQRREYMRAPWLKDHLDQILTKK